MYSISLWTESVTATNVYFLNGVTESDLMALAEKSDGSMSVIPAEDVCTCTEKCAAGEVKYLLPGLQE